jgi:hypothetical protein
MAMFHRYITAVTTKSKMRPTRCQVIAANRVGGAVSVSAGGAGVSASLKSGYVVTPASESSLGCVSL